MSPPPEKSDDRRNTIIFALVLVGILLALFLFGLGGMELFEYEATQGSGKMPPPATPATEQAN